MVEYTLGKKERLNSKTLIERLFSGGSKSFPAFPLRVVYMSVEPVEEDMAAASILISVPKKRFKRAVKRNLVKRRFHILVDNLEQGGHGTRVVRKEYNLVSLLYVEVDVAEQHRTIFQRFRQTGNFQNLITRFAFGRKDDARILT